MNQEVEEKFEAGNKCLVAQDFAGAKSNYLAAIELDGSFVPAYQNLATVALSPGHTAAAIALLKRAIAIDPNNGSAWSSLGGALWRAQRFGESAEALTKAMMLSPSWLVNYRLGWIGYAIGDTASAIMYLQRALDERPDEVRLQLDYAHAVLKSGDLARGLELFEARWNGPLLKEPIWNAGVPRWDGNRLPHGSVLLLHHEQGYGDTIQFCRFIPQIGEAAGFPRIIFACPREMHSLLHAQCAIDEVVSSSEDIASALKKATVHSPLISAVSVLKLTYATLPAPRVYIDPPEIDFDIRPGGAKLAVGLCWYGSETPWRGAERAVKVEELLELGTIPGVKLWSLQFGQREADLRATGADCFISTFPGGPGEFGLTAAFINALDLVVTVDSATAHLAGAIGKKCFMLNPVTPCWRWARGAAPWYGDIVEIFDQVTPSNWTEPIAKVRDRISSMIAPHTGGGNAPKSTP